MEQDIRFCELDGQRIAFATIGEGRCSSSADAGSRTSRRSGTILGPADSSSISRDAPRRALRPVGAGLSDALLGPTDDRARDADARGGAHGLGASPRSSSRARAPDSRPPRTQAAPGPHRSARLLRRLRSRTTSRRRRAARSWTSCARTGSSGGADARGSVRAARQRARSKHRAGTSGGRPMRRWPRPSSIDLPPMPGRSSRPDDAPRSRAAPARRPHRSDRPGTRARRCCRTCDSSR